ncbi:hypothetical protein C7N43_23895 [Sphingobacteriales bacterium UPWRP_1]|nr:hypothetical protein C7N43_23895 [Sphingobacteriales bacterium UPWRP_1]
MLRLFEKIFKIVFGRHFQAWGGHKVWRLASTWLAPLLVGFLAKFLSLSTKTARVGKVRILRSLFALLG